MNKINICYYLKHREIGHLYKLIRNKNIVLLSRPDGFD